MIERLTQSSKIIVLSILLLSLFFGKFLVSPLQAAVGINETINFQGKLHDSSNLNVADSTYTVVFKLYDASSGGTELWTETQSVTTTDGVFRVALGSVSSISGVDFNSDSLYLSVKVGADAEMTPRIRFTAVPYAFQAKNAATATNVKWSGLTAPTTNLSLAMSSYTSTFTYGATTSTSNLFNLTDTTSNTGTGYLLNVTTASGSTLKPFHVSAAGIEALMVDASGRVGIGTTSPGSLLNVRGSNPIMTLTNTAFGTNNWQIRHGGTASDTSSLGNAFSIHNSTSNQTGLVIRDNGNVLIGTDYNHGGAFNPSRVFIYGGANGANVDIMGEPVTGRDQSIIDLQSSDFETSSKSTYLVNFGPFGIAANDTLGLPSQDLGALVFSNNSAVIGTSLTVDLNFTTDEVRRMVLTSGGNLGLGDLTPASLFTVGDGDDFQINSTGAITAATGITSSGTINFSGLTASKAVFTDSSKNLSSTGTVGQDQGGTGFSTYTTGDLLYASATNTLSKRGIGSTGQVLTVVAGLPAWADAGACATCLVNNPSSIQTITPTGDTTGLSIKQTATGSPTADIFNVTDNAGSTYYLKVNSSGNVSMAGTLAVTGASTLTGGFDSNAASTVAGLTVDGSGNLTVSDGLTSLTSSSTTASTKALAISQTGATSGTDYAGYFTNTGAATTNVGLYVSATGATNNYSAIFENGNIGIGDTSPAAALTVGSGDLFQVNSSGAIAAATGITSSGTINFSGLSASSVVYTDASKNLTTTAPTSGTIGYWSRSGTTLSPTASSDSVSLAGGNLTVGTNGLSLIVGDGTNVAAGINIASNRAMVGYDGSNAVIQGGTTKGIKFNVNNASFGSGTAMTLDSTGNLTLTDGLTSLTSSSTTASNKALSVSQTGATAGTDYAGYFTNTGAATTNVGLYASATGATNNYAAIFENGNIGIGDTSPVSALTVGSGDLFQVNSSGNIVKINNITYSFPSSQAAGSGYVLSNNGSGTLTWTDLNTGGNAGPWTLSGNNLYPDSSSYSVGIGGITAPSRALEVNQSFRLSHATTVLSEMNISGNAADNRIWDFRGDATGFTGNAWNDAGSVNGQWLRVTRTGTTINTTSFPTGNVSIGTNTAAAKLYSLATTEQLRLGYDASNFTSFTVNSGGDLNLTPSGGDITISGTLAASGTGIVISGASSTTSGSATTYGGSFTAASSSTSGIGFLYGINSSTTLSGSGGASNAGGARIFAQTTNLSPAWVDMLGTDITVQAGVTTNSLQGTKISLINASAATIPIMYGVNIANISNATGTITNTYGMYVGDITTGTQTNTPFSFYASDANAYNYFAGNVGVGAVPSSGYKLHVSGGNAIVAQSATSALITIESSATGAAYDSRTLHLVSASNTTGHAYTEFRAGSTRAWSFGMDRADADKLKISLGTSFALPGAGDVMTFDTSSNVGIGTSSLSNKFTVTDTGTTNVAKFNGSASTQCTVVTGTGWSCSSDERLKDNITDISGSLDKLQNIRTVTYNWKNGGDPTKQIGFIAQNVEQYYPELVRTDESGYKSVLYAQFTPLIIEGMKEQQGQILGNTSTISNLSLSTNNLTTVQSTQSATLSTLQTEIDTIKTQLTSVTTTINNLISTIDSNTDAIASLISRLDYIKPVNGVGKLDQMEERLAFLENNAYASGSGSTNGGQVLGATLSGNLVYQDQEATIAALIVTGESNLNDLSVMGEANIGLIAVDGIEGSIDALGSPLKLQSTATGPLQIMANKVEFTQSGNVQIKQGDLEIQQGVIKANNKVRDAVTLNSGQTTIAVTGMAWSNAPVTITANASYDSYVWITDITADGFTINVKNAPSSDQKVYWQGLW